MLAEKGISRALSALGSRKHFLVESAAFVGLNGLDLATTLAILHAPCVTTSTAIFCPSERNQVIAPIMKSIGLGEFSLVYSLGTIATLALSLWGRVGADELRKRNHPLLANVMNSVPLLGLLAMNIYTINPVANNLMLIATHPMR